MSSAFTSEFARWKLALLLPAALLPTAQGIVEASGGTFRDEYDVFGVFITSPLELVYPLIVVLLTCSHFSEQVAARFLVGTRTRRAPHRYLAARVTAAAALGALVGVALVAVPLAAAFVVWPLIGDPFIDPSGYHLTALTAVTDSFTRESLSEMLRFGHAGYALFYLSWCAIHSACYAVLGTLALAVLPNRFLALIAPAALYLGQSIVASQNRVDVHPALIYSLFPFGLQQSTAATVITAAVLVAATMLAALAVVSRASHLRRFL